MLCHEQERLQHDIRTRHGDVPAGNPFARPQKKVTNCKVPIFGSRENYPKHKSDNQVPPSPRSRAAHTGSQKEPQHSPVLRLRWWWGVEGQQQSRTLLRSCALERKKLPFYRNLQGTSQDPKMGGVITITVLMAANGSRTAREIWAAEQQPRALPPNRWRKPSPASQVWARALWNQKEQFWVAARMNKGISLWPLYLSWHSKNYFLFPHYSNNNNFRHEFISE